MAAAVNLQQKPLHSPHSSGSSHSSKDDSLGSSYNLILEHVLTYSGTYDLPLRTMYAINANPRAQPSRPSSPSGNKTPTSPQMPNDAQFANADFQSSLLTQISNQRQQPRSLPPSFLSAFLRKCFPPELELVDFPQSLTALDYLKDLEHRRKREVAAAMKRLGISSDELKRGDPNGLLQQTPPIDAWLKNSNSIEHRIEKFYSQFYISIRRWTLINELSLRPFSKYNCVAMLNVLYPPTDAKLQRTEQPTTILTPETLTEQRKGFFQWIQRVEKYGNDILKPLMQQGKLEGDENGWPSVRRCLDEYLRIANRVIEDASRITGPEDLDSNGHRKDSSDSMNTPVSATSRDSRGSRKADSGVSFTSKEPAAGNSKRPSTSSSDRNKDLPPQPPLPTSDQAAQVAYDFGRAKTGGSTLEKIAREFRKIPIRSSPGSATKSNVTSGEGKLAATPTPSGHQSTRHSREASDASSTGTRVARDEPSGRGRSHSNIFRRSLSRIRARSRSRPSTSHGTRADEDDVPPTPSLPPPGVMSAFDDDDDDDERNRSRFKRSFSLSRGRSGSKGPTLRKMKSLGDTGRSRRPSGGEAFDVQEMKATKEAWEAKLNQPQGSGEVIGTAV